VLAGLLVRTDLPGRKIGLLLTGLMLAVPLYLQAAAWQAGFGLQGWATMAFGFPYWLEGWTGAIWVHTVAAIPWTTAIVGLGFWMVEPELEEQALLEASPRRVFCHVTLPAAWTALGVAAVWVFITVAGEMTVTDLFIVRTYAEELYTRRAASGDTPIQAFRGMASGLLLLACLIVAGLTLCAKLVPRDRPASVARRPVFRLGRLRLPAGILVGAALLQMIGVPLGNLCYKAGVLVTQTATGRVRTWSPMRCLWTVLKSPLDHAREFGWSVLIGAAAATAAVLTAIVLAWLVCRGRLRAGIVLLVLAMFLVVPGPVIGLAVIWLVNRPEVPLLGWLYGHSILAPWLALWIRSLPLATLIMWYSFRTIPPELLDAAAVDGAGPFRRLWRIALPGRPFAPLLAWIVALAFALGDLAASILVMPPGVTALSVRIFGLLHYGVEDRVAGICLALVALFAAIVGLVLWIARLRTDRAIIVGNTNGEDLFYNERHGTRQSFRLGLFGKRMTDEHA
jgi:iron(III) transport system permease protein